MEEHITTQSDTSTGYTVFWINMDAINIELMMKTCTWISKAGDTTSILKLELTRVLI